MRTLDLPGEAVSKQVASRTLAHIGLVATREIDQLGAKPVHLDRELRGARVRAIEFEIRTPEKTLDPELLGRLPGAEYLRLIERKTSRAKRVAKRVAHLLLGKLAQPGSDLRKGLALLAFRPLAHDLMSARCHFIERRVEIEHHERVAIGGRRARPDGLYPI